jgi:DNA-binding transcriptional LysR family regulator
MYFVSVAEQKNFTRAAEACLVAQPALFQQIRKLEDELRTPLFVRHRRGIELTAAGAAFLNYAKNALQLLSEGKKRVADIREFRLGIVTVMCAPTIATYWLPKVVSRYRGLYPDVEIRIIEKSGCEPTDLNQTMADVGVVQLDGPTTASARPLHQERLFADEQVVVFQANHALGQQANGARRAVPLLALANEALVLPKPPCGLRGIAARAFADAGIQPRVALESSQVEAICEMVAAGLGVGLMPRMAMRRTYPGLRWRSLARPAPRQTIGLTWFADRGLSPAAGAFVDALREEAAQSRRDRTRPTHRPEPARHFRQARMIGAGLGRHRA